eukprot:TRINITY_DN8236_c0_g1_i1.p3 TRINITY_DN8236_c0_g1~~TRINITY_DN8236_c0_g1_i1.p3  ORF type:complete len:159 (+),score=33.81 TRINITY_DN8236_c0_g1_i1:613-1089(+)
MPVLVVCHSMGAPAFLQAAEEMGGRDPGARAAAARVTGLLCLDGSNGKRKGWRIPRGEVVCRALPSLRTAAFVRGSMSQDCFSTLFERSAVSVISVDAESNHTFINPPRGDLLLTTAMRVWEPAVHPVEPISAGDARRVSSSTAPQGAASRQEPRRSL